MQGRCTPLPTVAIRVTTLALALPSLQISLQQEVRAARGKATLLRDSLTLVDYAGAEKLAGGDLTGMKATEGPRLNKAAFAFKAVCEAMSAGKVCVAATCARRAMPHPWLPLLDHSARTSSLTRTPSSRWR